jgi:hypothetical protein
MRSYLKLSLLIVGLLSAANIYAQQNNPVPIKVIPVKNKKGDTTSQKADTTISSEKGVRQVDLADFISGLFYTKPPEKKVDSITSKPSVAIVPAIGYTLVSRLAFVLSGNAAFKTGPNSRISTIVASSAITENKQFTLPISSSIWSRDNRYNFVGAARFYKYPQSTYGLGSSSAIADQDPMDYDFFQFYETVLRHVAGNLYLGLGYIVDNRWNISDKGDLNGTVSDYSLYGKAAHTLSSGFTFDGLLDSRDNAINPSKGGYVSLQYRDNYTFLGSNTPWRSLIVDVRKYFKFPEGSDNVIAFWSYDWLILSGKPGYLELPSTAWDALCVTGRGYIQGRFRGADMVYGESEYRYMITDNGLLGGVFFVNAESFSAAPGTKLQTIQPGYGPGLRIKINTLSKTNIAVDYGFGREGSNGLFINVGEVF